VVLVLVLVLVFAISSDSSSPTDQTRQVLRVVELGRRAIVADRPAEVCRLLTRRAQRNSLRLFNLDETPEGKPRAAPHTCAQAIGYQIDDARYDGEVPTLRRSAYRHPKVVRLAHNRAHVRIADNDIYLVRGQNGWRGDFASFAPFDGSSGY
jgi:hypothetical protein